MPFKSINTALPTSPTVTVAFTGLCLVHPALDSSYCEIGLHRKASDHRLRIDLVAIKPTGPPDLEPIHEDKLKGKDFTIRLVKDPQKGVTAYKPTPVPFQRNQPNDPNDLQWAINMGEYYTDVKTDPNGVDPCVRMEDGTFYTPPPTDKTKVKVELVKGTTTTDLFSIAGAIFGAIDISDTDLTAGQRVIVEWSENGKNQTLILPRPTDDLTRTKYLLEVANNPKPHGSSGHEELGLYYDVLLRKDGTSIPKSERYALNVTRLGLHPVRADEIPCMPVLLEP
ncbi:MAG: hypothetical protein QOH70_1275 [Blastocatellia bacterium]|jgi:hypothetical protein|nr:hypothetical protein [Blastocatellia bacterium]